MPIQEFVIKLYHLFQLETCEDFVERREIRKKLRELRQKRMECPDPEPTSTRSRHREVHTEEITTKTSDGVTVTETHKTKTEIIENGDVIASEQNVEESSKVEEDDEPEIGDVELDPEPNEEDEEEEKQEDEEGDQEEDQEEDQEKDQEEVPEETTEEAEATEEPPQEEETENVPPYLQKNPENLTEQEIEEIDDLDFLETTVSKK